MREMRLFGLFFWLNSLRLKEHLQNVLLRFYCLFATFCTFTGQWSGTTPHCQPVRCTALEILDAHLRVLSLNNSFRGQASFLCPFGYALVGPETIECGSDGAWSGSVPKCKAISCPSPLPPLNGKVMDNGHYLVGNTVQYNCNEGFVLIGEPIIRCTESGLWSHAPPFCKYKEYIQV